MNLSTLMNSQLDYSAENAIKAEEMELHLSPVMYAWFRDRLRERGRGEDCMTGSPPRLHLNGTPVIMDREQEGFRFTS